MTEQVADIESVVELPAPDQELAERATRRVEWADRFRVFRMAAGAGTLADDLYSMAEIGRFVLGTRWEMAGELDAKVTFNWVDVSKLITWIENVAGDKELADAIAGLNIDPKAPYKAQVDLLGPLLVSRYTQYMEVLGPETEESADSEESEGSE